MKRRVKREKGEETLNQEQDMEKQKLRHHPNILTEGEPDTRGKGVTE